MDATAAFGSSVEYAFAESTWLVGVPVLALGRTVVRGIVPDARPMALERVSCHQKDILESVPPSIVGLSLAQHRVLGSVWMDVCGINESGTEQQWGCKGVDCGPHIRCLGSRKRKGREKGRARGLPKAQRVLYGVTATARWNRRLVGRGAAYVRTGLDRFRQLFQFVNSRLRTHRQRCLRVGGEQCCRRYPQTIRSGILQLVRRIREGWYSLWSLGNLTDKRPSARQTGPCCRSWGVSNRSILSSLRSCCRSVLAPAIHGTRPHSILSRRPQRRISNSNKPTMIRKRRLDFICGRVCSTRLGLSTRQRPSCVQLEHQPLSSVWQSRRKRAS